MNKVLFPKKDYVKELVRIFKLSKNSQKLVKTLSKYHEKDIAEAITLLTPAERQHIYNVLDEHMIAEIFSYLDDTEKYLEELSLEKAARVVSYMDSDDAVDVLDDLSETKKNEIVEHLDADAKEDVQKLLSYEDDEIGSCMTNNFVCIPNTLTIREAMSALVKQAGEHDNISTIYVVNSAGKFAGAIDLKDLIIARQNDNLADIISSSYPYVYEHENINECIDKIADYEEDSIPVLTDDGKICGILTATDIVELVDDAMSDDYAKLAGLTSEDDLSEPTLVSIKKRLPCLLYCCFLEWQFHQL
ncbi:MAG: magnesium transporter MgtE N-terminal domain-containing protein [Eubacterium sp.]